MSMFNLGKITAGLVNAGNPRIPAQPSHRRHDEEAVRQAPPPSIDSDQRAASPRHHSSYSFSDLADMIKNAMRM